MIPAEKLVQQITTAMAQNADRATLERLASQYTAMCREASRRLEQCDAMLKAGSDYEALQLAEAQVPLLDTIAALSFDQSEQWRTLCRSKSFPAAEEFDAQVVSRLNELYGKGIQSTEELYKKYRKATAARDDSGALAALLSIVRTNPSDSTARGEIARLKQKLRDDMLTRLSGALKKKDVSGALELLAQIEASDWNPPPTGPVLEEARALRREWEKEQALQRCRSLLAWTERLHDDDNWKDALDPIQEIETLCATHGIALDSESAESFQQLRSWARELKRKHDEEQSFQATLREVAFMVEKGETEDTPSKSHSLHSAREAHHSLDSKWREVERFGKEIPDDVRTRVMRRLSVIKGEVERLSRQRKILTVVSLCVVASVLAVATVSLFRQQWVEARLSELDKLQQARQVTTAETFIHTLRQTKPAASANPKLQLQLQKTEAWIKEEKERNTTLQEMIAKLLHRAEAGSVSDSATEVFREFEQVQQFSGTVAPEYRTANETTLLELENKLDPFLLEEKRKRAAEFQALLEKGEKLAGDFERINVTTEDLQHGMAELTAIIKKLESLSHPAQAKLKPSETLISRLTALQTRLAPFQSDAEKVRRAEVDMRAAKTLQEYLAALEHYDAERFRQFPQVRSAKAALAIKSSFLQMEQQLLMPDDPEGWNYLISHPEVTTIPGAVMPSERAKWLSIRDDDNLRNICRYEIPAPENNEAATSQALRASYFYTLGAMEKKSSLGNETSLFRAMVFVPTPGAEKVNFVMSEKAYKDAGSTLVQPLPGGLSAESTLFTRLGLSELIDSESEKYVRSVLPMLDELRAAKSVSPLFKAYVHYQLLELVNIRRLDWGAHWSPAIATDHKRLRELGLSQLQSADWMIPRRITLFESKLTEFYSQTDGISYTKQVKFSEKLVRDLHSGGIAYAGYVAADSKPVLINEARSASKLWGLESNNQKPALLYKTTEGHAVLQSVTKPHLLTPLFYFQRDKSDILKTATKAAGLDDDSSIQSYLPPLFQ